MKKNIYKFLLILIFFFVVLILNSNTSFAFEFNGQEIPEFFSNDYQYYVYIFDGSRLICNCSNDSPFFVDNYYSFGAPVLSKNPKINAFLYRWTGTEWVFYRESAGYWNHFGNLEEYPILHSSYTVLDHLGNEYFIPISNNNNSNLTDWEDILSNFDLPVSSYLYDNNIIFFDNVNQFYTLVSSDKPIILNSSACSSCINNHSSNCQENDLQECVHIEQNFRVYYFDPNDDICDYVLVNQKSISPEMLNISTFAGQFFSNGWEYLKDFKKDDLNWIFYNHNNRLDFLYNSADINNNDFNNVVNHLTTNFNATNILSLVNNLDTSLVADKNFVLPNLDNIEGLFEYNIIYYDFNGEFYGLLSSSSPISYDVGGCRECNGGSFLNHLSGDCLHCQIGSNVLHALYNPDAFPTPNYNSEYMLNTELFELFFYKLNVEDDWGIGLPFGQHFEIVYCDYDVYTREGDLFYEPIDYSNFQNHVMQRFPDTTLKDNYYNHFNNLNNSENNENWLIRVLKSLFTPKEDTFLNFPNLIKNRFRFVDSISSAIGSLKEIFLDIDENSSVAPSLTIHNINSKFYQGDLTYLDLSWYTPFKPYGDLIITGFVYIFYLLRLFAHIPDIIHGMNSYAEVHSDRNQLIRSEKNGTSYYFRKNQRF